MRSAELSCTLAFDVWNQELTSVIGYVDSRTDIGHVAARWGWGMSGKVKVSKLCVSVAVHIRTTSAPPMRLDVLLRTQPGASVHLDTCTKRASFCSPSSNMVCAAQVIASDEERVGLVLAREKSLARRLGVEEAEASTLLQQNAFQLDQVLSLSCFPRGVRT